MFNNVYKGKKVLVTGHTGFKGSWTILWLNYLGAEVIGYSLPPPTKPSLFEVLGLETDITNIIGDIRDFEKLENVFKTYKPEIVIHMAAQPLVRYGYLNPRETYETNVIGTLNIFEASRKTESVRVVINVTSDKCYENRGWVYGYRENDPMGGYDPYSSSKGCAELLTSAYRNSYFNPSEYGKKHYVSLASVRAGNVIGGGDWAEDRLIPDCVRALSVRKPIHLRNPNAIRPWQYVLEPISGYLWLGALMWDEPTKYCEGWNFGPGDEVPMTVESLVKEVIDLWGGGSYILCRDAQFYESKFLRLDISKARHFLKWFPIYDLKTALKETVNWYKNFYSATVDMKLYTIKELERYVECAIEKRAPWALTKGGSEVGR